MPYDFAGLFSDEVLDTNGKAARSKVVSVYEDDGTTLATLWSDRAKTVSLAQPISTSTRGNLRFYTDPGEYKLQAAGSTFQVDVSVPVDPTEAVSEPTGVGDVLHRYAPTDVAIAAGAILVPTFTVDLIFHNPGGSFSAQDDDNAFPCVPGMYLVTVNISLTSPATAGHPLSLDVGTWQNHDFWTSSPTNGLLRSSATHHVWIQEGDDRIYGQIRNDHTSVSMTLNWCELLVTRLI